MLYASHQPPTVPTSSAPYPFISYPSRLAVSLRLALVGVCLFGCRPAEEREEIRLGMTEAEAIRAAGREPDFREALSADGGGWSLRYTGADGRDVHSMMIEGGQVVHITWFRHFDTFTEAEAARDVLVDSLVGLDGATVEWMETGDPAVDAAMHGAHRVVAVGDRAYLTGALRELPPPLRARRVFFTLSMGPNEP